MGHIIDCVGDLTAQRDRDALEETLVAVTLELIGAACLIMWRIVRVDGGVRLRQRVHLAVDGLGRSAAGPPLAGDILLPLAFQPDLYACYHANAPLNHATGERGEMRHVFPISDGRDVVSMLEVFTSGPLREEQQRLVAGMLRIYRNHIGILDDSDCDDLTGLFNRRTYSDAFRQIADAARTRALHGEERLRAHLAVIDIDYFKRINDRFGHAFGDEVLVLLARLMHDIFRDTDRLFRFGGEEFLAILSKATDSEAYDTLERFRIAVERHAFPQVAPVTVSIGYTAIAPEDTQTSAFGRADAALYVAKRQGRNRLRSHELLVEGGVIRREATLGRDVEIF